MLNPNIEQKLSRTVKELELLSEVEKNKVQRIFISDQVDENNLNILPTNIEYDEVCNPYIFTKPCKYYWVRCEFDIVDKGNEHIKSFLSLDTKINRVASTIRPQGLLYLNGEIVQGIDINHIEVSLDVGHYEMMMLFYTHDIEDPFPLYVDVIYKDKRIEKAYYDFYIPLQTLKILDQKDDNYFKMLPVLEKACNIIDFRNPYSLNFFDSLDKSLNYLYDNFYNSLCGSDLKVNVIGHSHIDVAWLWDYAQTREKVKRTFSTVLKLMDEYPEYKFIASTPQLYEFIKEDAPDLYEQIKQKVKEGRWEIEGALWLECDCNLTSGETLVRQIVEGKRFFEKEFNVDSKIVWLPDVFGYSGNLPQIMSKAGIEKFVTAKIGWNDTNRFPYDTFIWKGIDGSKVDAFLISTPDKCNPRKGIYDITYTTYCPDVTANYILGTWHRYSQKDFNQTTFMTMGWGDGGGGVTKEMLEAQRRFSYGIPGIPKTEISTVKPTETTTVTVPETSTEINTERITEKPKTEKPSSRSVSRKTNSKNFRITVYTPSSDGGKWGYSTSTGARSEHLKTCAVDPDVIPLGSIIEVNGIRLKAVDTGSEVNGNVVDIFYDGSSKEAREWINGFGEYHEVTIIE